MIAPLMSASRGPHRDAPALPRATSDAADDGPAGASSSVPTSTSDGSSVATISSIDRSEEFVLMPGKVAHHAQDRRLDRDLARIAGAQGITDDPAATGPQA